TTAPTATATGTPTAPGTAGSTPTAGAPTTAAGTPTSQAPGTTPAIGAPARGQSADPDRATGGTTGTGTGTGTGRVDGTGTVAGTTSGSPDPSGQAYTVLPGDTLFGIAQTHAVGGWLHLYQDNQSTVGGSPDLIFPGQQLHLS
ncbi:LysM domain-containing protein, partial [Kitasatospora nipponensis]|uniref:LysM peptidoglycan-binding domain-containing protein n=1 Tax=Kitasatospora nipponensis TaxID=258049 RepID=UPI0031D8C759